MPEEKKSPTGGEGNIFGEMDVTFGDVAEAEAVIKTTNWWKIGALASTLLTVVAAATFAAFGTDAFIKTAPRDSFIFSTGLFSKGGPACALVNGNVDAEYGDAGEPCWPLGDIVEDLGTRTDKLRTKTRDALSIYLDRKLNSDILDSAISRFIVARGPQTRIPYQGILDAISDKIDLTRIELMKRAHSPEKVKVQCGGVTIVGKGISFSCSVDADPVLAPDPRVTARAGVLTLLKNLQSIDKIRLKNYPKSLGSGGGLETSSAAVSLDLEYLLDVNQL